MSYLCGQARHLEQSENDVQSKLEADITYQRNLKFIIVGTPT